MPPSACTNQYNLRITETDRKIVNEWMSIVVGPLKTKLPITVVYSVKINRYGGIPVYIFIINFLSNKTKLSMNANKILK